MSVFQKAQKVITPDGEGLIEEVRGDEVIVKLGSGEVKTYPSDDIEDDSAAG